MIRQQKIELPQGAKKLLLHSCCAPCSGEVMELLLFSEIDFSIFFYNPNIHPLQEYEIRKQENINFARKYSISFIDADYDKEEWFKRIKGLEWEPERGKRCTLCFDMRFERTALYAHEHNYPIITSSLGISRWKDMNQINEAGIRAASRYPNLEYLTYNWRKEGGSERMYLIAKEHKLYKQEYCGCVYSLRDTNRWRKKNGRDRVKLGINYYGDKR